MGGEAAQSGYARRKGADVIFAFVRFDARARQIYLVPSSDHAIAWFRRPEVWSAVVETMRPLLASAKVAPDPGPRDRPHPAGTECPRTIAALLESRLRSEFPEETLHIRPHVEQVYNTMPRASATSERASR